MAEATSRAAATPNPSLPRTIGVLNIVFGLGLLACGTCGLGSGVWLTRGNPWLQLDPTLTGVAAQEMRRNFVEELRHREDAATDPGERARLRQERERLASRPTAIEDRVDFGRVNRGTSRMAVYLWADVVTGPLLNFAMVVAGIGLARLRPWGLRLGVWVALLKVVRQLALAILLLAFALPAFNAALDDFADTDFAEVTSATMREDQRRGQVSSPPVALAPEDIVKILKSGTYVWSLVYVALALVYPLVALVVLTRPAAAAALARAAEDRDAARA